MICILFCVIIWDLEKPASAYRRVLKFYSKISKQSLSLKCNVKICWPMTFQSYAVRLRALVLDSNDMLWDSNPIIWDFNDILCYEEYYKIYAKTEN